MILTASLLTPHATTVHYGNFSYHKVKYSISNGIFDFCEIMIELTIKKNSACLTNVRSPLSPNFSLISKLGWRLEVVLFKYSFNIIRYFLIVLEGPHVSLSVCYCYLIYINYSVATVISLY